MERLCEFCNTPFAPKRSDSLYCSHSCRQMAYVMRKATVNGIQEKPFASETESGQEIKVANDNEMELSVRTDNEKNELSVRTDKKLAVRTDAEKIKVESPESEYEAHSSRFLNELSDLYNERDNGSRVNSFFDNRNDAGIWVSEIYRCLLECLLLFSEMKEIELDDLKELCNAFTRLIQSGNFKKLHPRYPYINEIRDLRQRIKNTCLKAEGNTFINYRMAEEQKKSLIISRFELSEFVPKRKFSELNFKQKDS